MISTFKSTYRNLRTVELSLICQVQKLHCQFRQDVLRGPLEILKFRIYLINSNLLGIRCCKDPLSIILLPSAGYAYATAIMHAAKRNNVNCFIMPILTVDLAARIK